MNTLPGFEECATRADDVVYTPDDVARDIVEFFKPTGRILDPCKGGGAFLKYMPGAEWCEIREGRDFFDWHEPVDWIVSNPPYSIFASFLDHSFALAKDIVYLIPPSMILSSWKRIVDIAAWGGMPTIYMIAPGGRLGFPFGYATAAIHFRRGFTGPTRIVFRDDTRGARRGN